MEPVRILVVDDERAICDGCRLVLKEKGHVVDVCLNGNTGLDAILKRSYDVVLLDIKLPDVDGMDILRAVNKEKPGEYIIVMTGYSTVQNAVEAMKLGAFDYISKPFSDDELLFAIDRAVEKKRLVQENLDLRRQLLDQFSINNIVGTDSGILRIFDKICKVAPTETTVLIYGESGTGKELFARAIHAHSERAARQFVAVDCSTLSPGLLESELFGHVRGAFTGAVQDKAGVFEVAHGGTLFLDDVANLSLETQGKLLRVLEMREYKPVGTSHIKKANVRIIAATNKDLKAMVDEGSFREDLYYRLNVFLLLLPPLRERKNDIPKLAYHFLRHFCRKTGKRIEGFTDDALDLLVVQDIFLTETAQLADIVLPAASFAEKDGTFTNTERRVQRVNKAIDPPGTAKEDWKIIAKVAARLGYPMTYESSAEIMEEIARLTPIYAGIHYHRLNRGGLQWPCWDRQHPGTSILHEGRFTRGRGKFHVVEDKPPAELPSSAYPLLLTTGRLLEHWHTGSMSRRSRVLEALEPESLVEISPGDAAKLGIEEGDVISLSSRRGKVQTKARKTDRVRPGQAFMPFHWDDAPANVLTNPALDPLAKIPEYKVSSIKAILAVLERAAQDNEFLAALANNPAGTLSGYDLTPEHRAALAAGDISLIETWVGPLEERLRIWLQARLRQEKLAER